MSNRLNYVHKDWLPQIRSQIRSKHQNEEMFGIKYALDWEDVNNFTHGKLVPTERFKHISILLNLDWQQIQNPMKNGSYLQV